MDWKNNLLKFVSYAAAIVVIVLVILWAWMAFAHGIYTEMIKGTECYQCTGNECEAVQAIPINEWEARIRGLKFRVPGWGALREADSAGYFLPASGEFIPISWARTSPDDQFHRCTYFVNSYWTGREWKILPNNGTKDGLPPTRCFWHPIVSM